MYKDWCLYTEIRKPYRAYKAHNNRLETKCPYMNSKWTYTETKCLYKETNFFSEKKWFDPLLNLYVCPLTKKWSVYNFNCRFTWTVRDRITTTKIQKNAFKKSHKLICILMSEISIDPLNQQDFRLPCVFYTGKELILGEFSQRDCS